jgi:hypothetical protein
MLDELVSTLLYEGYALYPYTPGSPKNATPTPFGIVYPPVYAAECAGAHDHARLECLARPAPGATLTAELRFLAPSGDGHRAEEHRLELGPAAIGERDSAVFFGGRFTLRSEPHADGALVRACVHNTAEVGAGLDRSAALRHALISAHIVLRLSAGRFVSPLESKRPSVNIWPVLATPDDDTVLGAAIVLPDHPQIAPSSRGALFDNTEIEEALLLHVHALSDEERHAAGAADPAVQAMLDRALQTTPDDIVALHGGLRPGGADDNPGEARAVVDGVTFERGSRLILRPGTERDPFDRMLDGRSATLERIYIDYDGRVHLAVTVDDDPGQDLMRETGRYLFFFSHEVQPA